MDIRNSVDGLKTLLGVPTATPAQTQPAKSDAASGAGSAFAGDRATFSSAAAEVSQTASDDDVRMDKVAAVQAALAAGTYDISPAAVASKMVSSMLGAGQLAGN